MEKLLKLVAMAGMLALLGALLAACGSGGNEPEDSNTNVQSGEKQQQNTDKSAEPVLRTYKDSKGHSVQIPVHPQRVIFTGSDLGDILALDVKPIGAALGIIKDQVAYPDLLGDMEDIGDLLGDPKKIAALDPDLILLDSGGSYYEAGAYDKLAKIAPTVAYDRLDTNERLLVFGDILGKK